MYRLALMLAKSLHHASTACHNVYSRLVDCVILVWSSHRGPGHPCELPSRGLGQNVCAQLTAYRCLEGLAMCRSGSFQRAQGM